MLHGSLLCFIIWLIINNKYINLSVKNSIVFILFYMRWKFYYNLSKCICVWVPSWRLKLRPFSPHLTSTYTCGVTIVPRLYGSKLNSIVKGSRNFVRKKKVLRNFKNITSIIFQKRISLYILNLFFHCNNFGFG